MIDLVCVFVPPPAPQPPPAQVAVVSGGEDVQDLTHLKMKVRSELVQRPKKSSGRQPQVKILRPPAVSSAEDKEVKKKRVPLVKEHQCSHVLFAD